MRMDLMERIAGLPKRPHPAATSGPTEYYLKMIEYREAQLALAREWIDANVDHRDTCPHRWLAGNHKGLTHGCTCGRDALLDAMTEPTPDEECPECFGTGKAVYPDGVYECCTPPHPDALEVPRG